jgi:hypothetical protein
MVVALFKKQEYVQKEGEKLQNGKATIESSYQSLI